jgi:hypothetical protein
MWMHETVRVLMWMHETVRVLLWMHETVRVLLDHMCAAFKSAGVRFNNISSSSSSSSSGRPLQ